MVKGGNQHPQIVFWPSYVYYGTQVHRQRGEGEGEMGKGEI